MAALILPLISNKNGAVYDSTAGVIRRLLQSDVAKAGIAYPLKGLTESCGADSEAVHSVFSRAKVACPT